jgi:hypothetical protein
MINMRKRKMKRIRKLKKDFMVRIMRKRKMKRIGKEEREKHE